MEKIPVDAYKFKRISSFMAKTFGTLPASKEEEEPYSKMLFLLESNLLKLHRQNPLSTDQHAIDAILMSLLTIDGYIKKIEYDYSNFVNEYNQVFHLWLLMTFDPFTNPDIHKRIIKNKDNFDQEEYFKPWIQCLLRLEKSIRLWTKDYGKCGYFDFIEGQIGHSIKSNNKLDYWIQK